MKQKIETEVSQELDTKVAEVVPQSYESENPENKILAAEAGMALMDSEVSPEKQRKLDRQWLFLAAFAESGRVGIAAKAVGLSRAAHDHWIQDDQDNYRERFKAAHQAYIETIESMMDQRLADPSGNRGSDVLLMFKLKAEAPEKYRETVNVVDTTDTKDLLKNMRRLGTPRVVEGESRMVSEPGPSQPPEEDKQGP